MDDKYRPCEMGHPRHSASHRLIHLVLDGGQPEFVHFVFRLLLSFLVFQLVSFLNLYMSLLGSCQVLNFECKPAALAHHVCAIMFLQNVYN